MLFLFEDNNVIGEDTLVVKLLGTNSQPLALPNEGENVKLPVLPISMLFDAAPNNTSVVTGFTVGLPGLFFNREF